MQRSSLLVILIFLIGIIYIGRLFQLQVIEGKSVNPINSATVKIEYDYPQRGYIYDRNGKLLVANQLSYDVMVIPKEVKNIDTLQFCSLLKITKQDFLRRFNKAEKYARWLPSVFLKQVAKEDFAYLQEKLHKFKGFYIQRRIIRNYPIKSGANILGFLGEVNEQQAKKSEYYENGELIGKSGIENYYENELRGVKGKKYFNRDNLNRITGSYKSGEYDTLAVAGKDLTLTLDSDLQRYGELLMNGKRGGIVALEPATGELLALVTAPSYDPNMMVGRKRRTFSQKLFSDTINNPTIDRGLQAVYSPGSPFKILNGLIGLQENVIDPRTAIYCNGGYRYGKRKHEFMRCHCGVYGRPIRLKEAIAKSCNSYFAETYRKIINKSENTKTGFDNWSNHVKSFGLGNFLGYDLPVGNKGLVPNSKYYDDRYSFGWRATTNISNAIGQGEILTTPIQLANATAAIANRGFYYTPHIVKRISNSPIDNSKFIIKKTTTINSNHFPTVIEAMHEVFKTGTGKYSQVKGIDICGKTGTVENFAIINGEKVQLTDHSILIAFAPKENPKIAMAVFVENGGFGSTIAAPITSLMIEKYLNGDVQRKNIEERMMNLSLKDTYNKQLEKRDSLETIKE
ncbi:penicillin-binding protein 2 [Tenacibaculum sp. SZ-18]|uniref:penicillin-binding protein 2 n=1 Tax=Tenacibaculum sp. SZ-18 TaxID=754423 RepID=UPI000C2D4CA4|nr:penicillin-binding protein 2 [Tenacibaculum sp. SZ-18]AUC14077.1 penicillin-binding protein 2 [Tenacibaculum sp. SZ-18]